MSNDFTDLINVDVECLNLLLKLIHTLRENRDNNLTKFGCNLVNIGFF